LQVALADCIKVLAVVTPVRFILIIVMAGIISAGFPTLIALVFAFTGAGGAFEMLPIRLVPLTVLHRHILMMRLAFC
jgi:hypothetical protein